MWAGRRQVWASCCLQDSMHAACVSFYYRHVLSYITVVFCGQ